MSNSVDGLRVTVANMKGGVGKTTTAVHLAECLARRAGGSVLVDADPQGSATRWAAMAEGHLSFPIVPVGGRDIRGLLGGHVTAVVDCPPAGAGVIRDAIAAAEVVVVPMRPTILDLDRVTPTLDLCGELGVPAAVLLTQVRAATTSLREARASLDGAGLPLMRTAIPARELIAASVGGPLHYLALALYEAVLGELLAGLGREGG
ncbi:MAG: AAA family ATPase, partial [Acidimicrobiales bacterium]